MSRIFNCMLFVVIFVSQSNLEIISGYIILEITKLTYICLSKVGNKRIWRFLFFLVVIKLVFCTKTHTHTLLYISVARINTKFLKFNLQLENTSKCRKNRKIIKCKNSYTFENFKTSDGFFLDGIHLSNRNDELDSSF